MRMLKQPLWHRLLNEALANWELHRIVKQYREFSGHPGAGRNNSHPAFYRVGLVGCGRVARRHALGYLKSQRVRLVTASDPAETQRRRAQSRLCLDRVYSDY